MSENGFVVGHLPSAGPLVSTGADDEVLFHFGGVRLDIDESDGSFTIRDAYSNLQFYHRMQIVQTGLIDKKGKYTFSERSRWAKEKEKGESRVPFQGEIEFDDTCYFKNEIEYALKQQKVRVYV